METITLNNGVEIPQTELGVFQVTNPTTCKQSVMSALSVGYRLFDTAACYGNERAVGEALFESDISRNEVFSLPKSGSKMPATIQHARLLKKHLLI